MNVIVTSQTRTLTKTNLTEKYTKKLARNKKNKTFLGF